MSFIKLDNGKFLTKDGGKYGSQLTFICRNELEPLNEPFAFVTGPRVYHFLDRICSAVRGKFWKSPKGTNCFEAEENGPNLMIKESWGRNGDRGHLEDMEQSLYYRRASSNGGGNGCTYIVIPFVEDTKMKVEDI